MIKFLAGLFGSASKPTEVPRHSPKTSTAASNVPATEASISADQLVLMTAKVNASANIEPVARQRVIDHLSGKTKLFETDDYLALEEKRAMGLNTRQKLHRDLTTVLSDTGLKCANPSAVVKELGLASYMDAQKMASITKLQATGVTKGVRIVACDAGGDKPCAWSKSNGRKVLPSSPETECERRKHCNAEPYCMGYYEAVLADL
jgi:hypothetical protein